MLYAGTETPDFTSHLQPFLLFPVHSSLMIQASVHDLHHCNTAAMAQQQRTPISESQG